MPPGKKIKPANSNSKSSDGNTPSRSTTPAKKQSTTNTKSKSTPASRSQTPNDRNNPNSNDNKPPKRPVTAPKSRPTTASSTRSSTSQKNDTSKPNTPEPQPLEKQGTFSSFRKWISTKTTTPEPENTEKTPKTPKTPKSPKTPNKKDKDKDSATISTDGEDNNSDMEEKSSIKQWFSVKWREFSAMLFQGHKGPITDMIVTDKSYHYCSHINTLDKSKQPYWLFTCGEDGDIRQYQILTCQCMKKFTPHHGGVKSMEILFINNHPYLFSIGNDGNINCHNLLTGALFRKYSKAKDVTCYHVSPKTKSIFIGTSSGPIYRLNLISTQQMQLFSGLTKAVLALYHRKDMTKECLYSCCADQTGRVFNMEGKTERLIRIKKTVKKLEFTKQRQLYMICDDGTFLTMDPESGNVVTSEKPITEGTLVTYKTCAHLLYYTVKEDNYVHVLDTKKDRMLRSFNPHGDNINAIQVTGNTFLWTASSDGSVLQTHMQMNTTEREFKSRPKDTLIGLIQLVISFCQLLSYPFLSYSDFMSVVIGFFTGGKGAAGIFGSDMAVTVFYHVKLVGTILALTVLFFVLYKQYVPNYRRDIEMIELYGNLYGPDQSSRRSKSKMMKSNKSGISSRSIKNLNSTNTPTSTVKKSPKSPGEMLTSKRNLNEKSNATLLKSGTVSTFTVNESTNELNLKVKPPPEKTPKIVIRSDDKNKNKSDNNDGGNLSPTSPSNPTKKSPVMLNNLSKSVLASKRKSKRGSVDSFSSLADVEANELDGMTPHDNEEKVDDGTVTPKQFSRMKIIKKILWFYIWICTTSLFIPFLSILFGIFNCATFYEKSENYNVTGDYTTYNGISSAPELECWSAVHIIYIIFAIVVIVIFLLIGTRVHRIDGDIEYMAHILRPSDWFTTWSEDRFSLYSDILVKVTMTYNFVDAIMKILIAITDSVTETGNVGAGVVYTVTAIVLFVTGICWPPHARTGMNYFLAATNAALIWCNCCSLIASAQANCKEGPEECDTEPYYPTGYFLGFIIPFMAIGVVICHFISPRPMDGKTALFQCNYLQKVLCCKSNKVKPDDSKKRPSSTSLGFDNNDDGEPKVSKWGVLSSVSKAFGSKATESELDTGNNVASVSINTPSERNDSNGSSTNLGNTTDSQSLLQTMFKNKQKGNNNNNNTANSNTPNSNSNSNNNETPKSPATKGILNTKKNRGSVKAASRSSTPQSKPITPPAPPSENKEEEKPKNKTPKEEKPKENDNKPKNEEKSKDKKRDKSNKKNDKTPKESDVSIPQPLSISVDKSDKKLNKPNMSKNRSETPSKSNKKNDNNDRPKTPVRLPPLNKKK